MKITYRQIEYVREVASCKSVTSASKNLHISQSSVLAAINQAEETTGVRLFYRRQGHGMELTPAGQEFLISARRFLAAGEEFDRSLEGFTRSTTPTLRVGCFAPFGPVLIPPIIRRYKDEYGDCQIILLEGDQTELRNWITSGTVDLVVTYDIGELFGTGVTPICRCPAHAILHADDPHAGRKSIPMKLLTKKPHILLDLPETRSYLLALFDFAGQRPDIVLKTRSYNTIRAAVANGIGASMLNIRPAKTSPDNPNVIRIPISDELRQPTLMVVDPYGDSKPEYVKSFVRSLYDYIADLGPSGFAVVQKNREGDLLYDRPKI
ncbi:MAG: LysR family transcriptional regulator [Granulosicoccus sp.]